MYRKAYRWVEEMRQIGQTFDGEGGWEGRASDFREIAGVFEELAEVVEREVRDGGVEEGVDSVEGVVEMLGSVLKESRERK